MEIGPFKTETAMMVFGNISSACWDNLERKMFAGAYDIGNNVYAHVTDRVKEPVQLLFDDYSIALRESMKT